MRRSLILALFVSFTALTVTAQAAQQGVLDSSVHYEKIGSYDTARLDVILTTEYADFSSFAVSYPKAQNAVDLYRISYPTVVPEQGNRPVRATGLLAVPQRQDSAPMPVLSYQHGTVFTKDAVPSQPENSMETRMAVAAFAAHGYVVIAADYIGKGDATDQPDSYMVKESTAQACSDMLSAAREVLGQLQVQTSGELFLSGWSQGSFSTLAFLNRLESSGETVTAAGFASAPSDLYVCVNRWIHVPSELDVQWLLGAVTLLIHSYEAYYELPGLADIAFRPQYRETAKQFYENTIGWEDVAKVYPETTAELLEPSFIEAGSLLSSRFFGQLVQNRSYSLRFQTPTRFYYGEQDEVLTPYIATLPVEYQATIGGATATAVPAGATANHRATFAFGLANQQEWFAGLLSAPAAGQ